MGVISENWTEHNKLDRSKMVKRVRGQWIPRHWESQLGYMKGLINAEYTLAQYLNYLLALTISYLTAFKQCRLRPFENWTI